MTHHEDFPDFDLRNLLGGYLAPEEISGCSNAVAQPPPCARSGKLVQGSASRHRLWTTLPEFVQSLPCICNLLAAKGRFGHGTTRRLDEDRDAVNELGPGSGPF